MTASERCEVCRKWCNWSFCRLPSKTETECKRHFAEAKGEIWAPKIIAGARDISGEER